MSISLFTLLLVGIPGIILLLIGVLIGIFGRKKRKHCTAKTVGTVYGYRYSGGSGAGSVAPRAEFDVGGKTYKAYRHYKGVVATKKKIVPHPDCILGQQDSFWISEKDWFHINTKGVSTNYKKMGESVWPIGSEVEVIYDPDKPKHAYVEKVVTNPVVPTVLICCGIFLMLMGSVLAALSSGKGYIGEVAGEDGRIEAKRDYSTAPDFLQIERDYYSEDGTYSLSIYTDEETGYCMVDFISDNDDIPSVSGDIYKIKTKTEATSLNVYYTLKINTEAGQDEIEFTYRTSGGGWEIDLFGVELFCRP